MRHDLISYKCISLILMRKDFKDIVCIFKRDALISFLNPKGEYEL